MVKRASYFIFYRYLRVLTPIPIPLDSGDFCLIDRKVIDQLAAIPERDRLVRGLRAWVGFRQVGLEYERHGRHAGDPKYSYQKLFLLAFDGIVNFSYRHLQVSGVLGFLVSVLSFLGMVFFLMHRLLGFKIFGYSPNDVPGFTSLILAILFLGGIQLVTLWVFGEYLGRICPKDQKQIKSTSIFDSWSIALPILEGARLRERFRELSHESRGVRLPDVIVLLPVDFGRTALEQRNYRLKFASAVFQVWVRKQSDTSGALPRS